MESIQKQIIIQNDFFEELFCFNYLRIHVFIQNISEHHFHQSF